MNTIHTAFASCGFDFRLVKRDGPRALFEKKRHGTGAKSWEVVILQRQKARTWPSGVTTPDCESMPASEQWGDAGWSYNRLEDAEKRYSLLVAARKMR